MRFKTGCAGLLLLTCLAASSQEYTVSTLAGGVPAPTPAVATQASLGSPFGLAVNAVGDLFVSADNSVFKVDRAGVLTRVAGTGVAGYSGDGGPALRAQLNDPQGLAFDPSGSLYIAESLNQVVRKVRPDGTITTVAGIPCSYAAVGERCGFGPTGDNVPATTVHLSLSSIATDSAGNLYLTDGGSVRKVDVSGTISTLTADADSYGPHALAVDATDNVYSTGTVYVAPSSSWSYILKVPLAARLPGPWTTISRRISLSMLLAIYWLAPIFAASSG